MKSVQSTSHSQARIITKIIIFLDINTTIIIIEISPLKIWEKLSYSRHSSLYKTYLLKLLSDISGGYVENSING